MIRLNSLQREAVQKALGGVPPRLAEKLAGIKHRAGRSTYGFRRAAVDAAQELRVSDEVLMVQGSWSKIGTPKTTYANQRPDWALEEAASALERIRKGLRS